MPVPRCLAMRSLLAQAVVADAAAYFRLGLAKFGKPLHLLFSDGAGFVLLFFDLGGFGFELNFGGFQLTLFAFGVFHALETCPRARDLLLGEADLREERLVLFVGLDAKDCSRNFRIFSCWPWISYSYFRLASSSAFMAALAFLTRFLAALSLVSIAWRCFGRAATSA